MIKVKSIDNKTIEIVNNDVYILKVSSNELFLVSIATSFLEIIKQKINNPLIEIEFINKEEIYLEIKLNSNLDAMSIRKKVIDLFEKESNIINLIKNCVKITFTIYNNNEIIAFKESIMPTQIHHNHEFDDDEGISCSCCH